MHFLCFFFSGENMQELSLTLFKKIFWFLTILLLYELVPKWQAKEINFDCSGCMQNKKKLMDITNK